MGFWTTWHSNTRDAVDEEQLALLDRFNAEGLDVQVLTDSQKLSHVWQWLLDAESNCLSLRRQIDKLHRQHEQDLKEVEEYLEHVWKLSNDRLRQLETENKSLKKQSTINCNNSKTNESTVKGNGINGNQLKQNSVDNLCDSLKLKSSLKQIIQNANENNDFGKRVEINNYINSHNKSNRSKAISPKSRRRNTVSNICDTTTDNNVINANNKTLEEEFHALQAEMCQQFKNIINQLEDRIISLEKSNRNLEIENETLSYKLSESQSQCDQMEHQLLKMNDKRGRQSSRLSLNSPIVEEVTDTSNEDPTLGSLQLLLASRLGSDLDNNDLNLAKQLHEFKSDKQRLEEELNNRSHQLKELLQKYERRKVRHKEMLVRLRTHIERENRQLQELLRSTDYKYKLAEEELKKHKKYCRISDITAINDLE